MKVIEAEELVKNYSVRQIRTTSIKELILKNLFKPARRKEIQALKGISFAIQQGQAVGIIGNNGSGKTTLLKLMAGITPPTAGTLTIRGRVGALLELGVGFHPDLTGLENIFLNAAMLGIGAQEVRHRLHSIIEFAELEKFINMPVKHYSSGMYVRLGFSIAVNINPDILLIDEVLAVGDSQFQVKSFNKIREFKKEGRTIIIVTHNLEQAEPISDEFIWLDNGEIKMRGAPNAVIDKYMSRIYTDQKELEQVPFTPELAILSERIRMGSGEAVIEQARIKDETGQQVWRLVNGKKYELELHLRTHQPIEHMDCDFGIGQKYGPPAISYCTASQKGLELKNLNGSYIIRLTFDPFLVEPGQYTLNIMIFPYGQRDTPYDLHLRLYPFTVIDGDMEGPRPAVRLPTNFELIEN